MSTADMKLDERRWAMLESRTTTAEETFFYAVKTTRIYCRSACSAKRPLRENVAFFDSISDAEAAGFRPCKRCRPDGQSLSQDHAAIVAEVCRLIETSSKVPSLDELAAS